ncbi:MULTISPECIES: DUF2267 domain-containing protein [unclassified Nitratiruptor]|uniref:DUF2267 domain-containing protein n=1 Tax=unclassified Nitratiruptor TaxID=2624044 RepID=UPI001916A224|nr:MULTISPECIES: DUF2267 domain-containing protein [unclassified Nitratiruptor]BCD59468.1 hypothetical protein NitYY0810_C0209 [Nitratiruptor sp. YY08-10]BCD63392.1 hypothetical protein NitYY0814_C0209 [Nitratiruptor sp. YY08-14]
MHFEKDVQKTKEFLKEFAQVAALEDIQQANRIVRAVLRVLRRRVAPQEYLDLLAQLPICIKAEGVEGWRLSEFPDKSIRKLKNFIEAVMKEDRGSHKDFGDDPERAKALVKEFFAFLKRHISSGEIEDLAAELPEEIKKFVQEA